MRGSEGGGTRGDTKCEDGGGKRHHTSEVSSRQTENDRGGPGGLAGQHDLMTTRDMDEVQKEGNWNTVVTVVVVMSLF